MAEGIDQAAQAFDKEIGGESKSNEVRPTPEVLFKNLGELDPTSEPEGGGDNESVEDLIYGKSRKSEAGPRHPRKEDGTDSESDDDESGGDDDDRSGDGDDDTEEEGEEDASLDPAILDQKFEIKVDGELTEVTLKEAIEGYVRTETFHRRMNQLDEAKKIVRRAAADAVQNYEYSMNIAKQMEAHMEQMIPKEPNWDEEFQKDPVKARELQRYYEKANGFRQQLQTQMQEANKKMQESNHAQLAAFAEEEAGKFEADNRKTWTDPAKKAKDLQSMRKTALATGFSEEELSQVYDSRMLKILLKASKYDRMMAAKPKPVVRTSAKPIPPGTGSARQRTVQRGVTSAMKRLNRTGSVDDAAVVFDQIIAKG
jgi:hypothetical protein